MLDSTVLEHADILELRFKLGNRSQTLPPQVGKCFHERVVVLLIKQWKHETNFLIFESLCYPFLGTDGAQVSKGLGSLLLTKSKLILRKSDSQ